VIINFAAFLEEHNYFEESYKAFERGIALFNWPHVFDIWNTYLTKFIDRYGGKKLERARDLFEQCLEKCPSKFAKQLYLLYAKLEEDYGLSRHAMAVYERATKAVAGQEQFEVFNIYVKRAAELFGITHTREIYERAIEALKDEHARDTCLRYADMETKLGEIDRARGVYSYGSQMCDPRLTQHYWKTWHDFEVKHGNEDTFREMLRIKRSVQAQHNSQVNFMSAQLLATQTIAAEEEKKNDMQRLEEEAVREAADAAESEKSSKDPKKRGMMFVRGETTQADGVESVEANTVNPDQIELEEESDSSSEDESDGEESEGKKKEIVLEQKSIPDEVFGGLRKDSDS